MDELPIIDVNEPNSQMKVFFAKKHFWNKWQGFRTDTLEEYKDWQETHKDWKKCRVFYNGIINIPNVPIKKWSLKEKG